MEQILSIILFFIGLFFFCDTVIPDRMKDHYRFWYWYIPGYQTFQLIIKLLRGVKYIPANLYHPLEKNFSVTNRELRYYIFEHLADYYNMTATEYIESNKDIKILQYGTPKGSDHYCFNIVFKAKLDGKWVVRSLTTDEEEVKLFQKILRLSS